MTDFYTNIFVRGNYVYCRGYKDGQRFSHKEHYRPYVFVHKPDGVYRTVNGIQCGKFQFDSIKQAKDFTERYKDVDNFKVYGLTIWPYLYIYDNFPGEIKYDPSLVSVVSLDIECAADEGFPDIKVADKEITAITIRRNKRTVVFGCGDFKTTDQSITYVKCKDEGELLTKFISVWNHNSFKPDIVTGWNIEIFDIPYLINRITRVLGVEQAYKLSPFIFHE